MIIAFTGKAGHGKSTASGMVQELRPEFKRINFKDALVKEMRERLPDALEAILVNRSEYDVYSTIDDLFTYKPPLMRALMQNYGTEVRRGDDKDYWTKQWKQNVVLANSSIVCDDVRFLNEAEAVKENQGIIIRVVKVGDEEGSHTHQSETEQDAIKADYTINLRHNTHDRLREILIEILNREDERQKLKQESNDNR